jgi:hypothetical protein
LKGKKINKLDFVHVTKGKEKKRKKLTQLSFGEDAE